MAGLNAGLNPNPVLHSPAEQSTASEVDPLVTEIFGEWYTNLFD